MALTANKIKIRPDAPKSTEVLLIDSAIPASGIPSSPITQVI
jgi:hypothetical protein